MLNRMCYFYQFPEKPVSIAIEYLNLAVLFFLENALIEYGIHFKDLLSLGKNSKLALETFNYFTALTVKYITRRFINEYDPDLGKYSNHWWSSRLKSK